MQTAHIIIAQQMETKEMKNTGAQAKIQLKVLMYGIQKINLVSAVFIKSFTTLSLGNMENAVIKLQLNYLI